MTIEEIRVYIKDKAAEFGALPIGGLNKSYVERNNTKQDALNDNGAYFGFIHPDEEPTGPFHDFSFTIFPSTNDEPWLVCLGIGSSGFRNDYELASFPGVRRLFSQLIDTDGFCKSDFSDIDTGLPKYITNNEKIQHIAKTVKKYTKVLPACQIVDNPSSADGKKMIDAFLAGYAQIRGWPSNSKHRAAIKNAITPFNVTNIENHLEKVKELLLERRYVVLQGPPGTGKTRIAKQVGNALSSKVFFTQFHAETSYSDFIYGIRPDIVGDGIRYTGQSGEFTQAIEYSLNNTDKTVVLIIDEINRANLSNVLGPIFYLFEHKMEPSDVDIAITPTLKINSLPSNLYVMATMNTADRSLAIVDFALRRRFAWYTLTPEPINTDNFYKQDFEDIYLIFRWYASSSELPLQPGQGYFIASSDDEMLQRVRYEIYPLIQEYLQEGLLLSAKEEFNTYFRRRINKSLFE